MLIPHADQQDFAGKNSVKIELQLIKSPGLNPFSEVNLQEAANIMPIVIVESTAICA